MITIDMHCDLLSYLGEKGIDTFHSNKPEQITKEGWDLGGPDLLVMAIYVLEKYLPHQKEAQALKMAGIFWKMALDGHFLPVLSKGELEHSGKKALLAIEGGAPLEHAEDLYAFYRLGVRMISLCWNYQNHLATGCHEKYSGGLTLKGKEIVKKAEELSILLDVSHLSEGSFWDLVDICKLPIIATHSNSYTLKPHPRNLKNDALKEIARTGGVVGVNFFPEFLQSPDLQAVIEQIKYIAETIGVEHVGIGSDYLGIDKVPVGLENISKWMSLDAELEKVGFAKPEREAILGGNFKRVLGKVL